MKMPPPTGRFPVAMLLVNEHPVMAKSVPSTQMPAPSSADVLLWIEVFAKDNTAGPCTAIAPPMFVAVLFLISQSFNANDVSKLENEPIVPPSCPELPSNTQLLNVADPPAKTTAPPPFVGLPFVKLRSLMT